MAYTVTEISQYDNKRMKVTLDFGGEAFILYKGELGKLRLKEGDVLSEETYAGIMEEILLPRAKKRMLYYMKNADKTRNEIKRKLREGLYPVPVIEGVMSFLDKYGIADDENYAKIRVEALKGKKSRREIEASLRQKGISRELINESLEELSYEDEKEACSAALRKRFHGGFTGENRMKAYAYLARKGFPREIIEDTLPERDRFS